MKYKRSKGRPSLRSFSFSIESESEVPPPFPEKNLNLEKESKMRTKNQRLTPAIPYSLKSALRKTYGEYCLESSIHGMNYLHYERSQRENLFWLILILISLIICATQIKDEYDRWQTTPVIISFSEEPTPVSQIPFPAITICPETKSVKNERLNFTRFFHYLRSHNKEIIKPPAWLTEDEFLKMRSLLQVCGNYLVRDLNFPEYSPMSVTDHLNEIAPKFTDEFIFCKFNQTFGPCPPLFDKIYTEEGICYTFNALNSSELYRKDTHQYKYFANDKNLRQRNKPLDWDSASGYYHVDDYDTYPERVLGCSLREGLLLSLQGFQKDLDYICRGAIQGFKVILHAPDDIPQVDKHFIHVPYDQDILILIRPSFVFTTDDIRHYSPEERNCYYPNERYLRFFQFYTQKNCELECMTNFTLRNCGCVKFDMPRLSNTLVCDASKITCYDKAEDDFLLSEFTGLKPQYEKCNCLQDCYTLRYRHELSQGIFNIDKVMEAYDALQHENPFKGSNVSRISIYFRANQFTALKRSELFGLTAFLASCGGLFGLFMGVSVISFVELFYHFTVRLYNNIREMKRRQTH